MTSTVLFRRALAASAAALLWPALACLTADPTDAQAAAPQRAWKAPASAAAATNPIPADERSRAKGKTLYSKECASCHGQTGKGNGPDAADLSRQPPDFSSASVTQQSDGELFWKMTQGRKPMPRFGRSLTDENRWHLVNYIRSLGH